MTRLFNLNSIGFFCVGCGLAWGGMKYSRSQAAIATVNGDAVTRQEFYSTMKQLSGREALSHLIEMKAILHEARLNHLKADEGEILALLSPSQKEERNKDPELRDDIDLQASATIVLRKLLLKSVTDDEKHKFYDLFKPDLTRYELAVICPQAREDVAAVERELKAGHKFSDVADTYPSRVKAQAHGKLAPQTRVTLLALGGEARDRILSLKPGEIGYRIPSTAGTLFAQMIAVHSSYDDLKANIEDTIAESGRVALLDRLTNDAVIVSPYVGQPTPSPTPGAASPTP